MPWGAVIGAGIGLVGSVMASDSADSRQQEQLDAQGRVADSQTALGRDQLDFNKQVYNDGATTRADAAAAAKAGSTAQLNAMQFALDQAQKDQAYREGTFQPLEKGIVADATGYDTAQRRTDAAAAAQADVNQSFDANRAATERELARSGIAPGSAKAMSVMADAQYAQAAAGAGAGTMAVRNVEQQGYARRMDAASLGRNLPANQATQQQIGTTAGTAGVNSAAAAVAAQQSGVPNVNAGYAGAAGANNSAGNLFGSAASGFNSLGVRQDAGLAGLGRAVGSSGFGSDFGSWMQSGLDTARTGYTYDPTGAGTNYTGGAYHDPTYDSDEKIKDDTEQPANGEKALAEVTALPIKEGWSYKKGAKPDDGGKPHIGPMAQQVRKHMGEEVAPGGKVISHVDMNGKMLAAIQTLGKKVQRLERRAA